MARIAKSVIATVFSVGVMLAAPNGESALAATYCPDGQFSAKNNPNGVWSYLVNGGLLADKFLMNGNRLLPCWWNGRQLPNSGELCKNETDRTQVYVTTVVMPPGIIRLDPQDNKSVAVRWTAPAAGTFAIKGEFVGIDTFEHRHPVQVVHNSIVVWTREMTAYKQTFHFNLTETIASGDTIDFVVADPNDELISLSTGLRARIITAPAASGVGYPE